MLKTFKIGGVHPPENKLTSGGKIQKLPVPEQVIIPLGQHIGAPATPVVQKGDTVKAGQLSVRHQDSYLPMYTVLSQELFWP